MPGTDEAKGEGYDYYWSARHPMHLFVRLARDGTLWKVPYKHGGWHERVAYREHLADTDLRVMDAPRKVNLFAETAGHGVPLAAADRLPGG